MAIPNQDLKKCTQCGTDKPLSDFYKRNTKWKPKSPQTEGLAECKVCTRKRTHDRKYSEKYREICDKDNAHAKIKNKKLRDDTFAAYGGYECVCCGETEPLFMSLDHINNDGAEFRKETFGRRTTAGWHTYKWLQKNGYPSGIQVLCMNCNHGKRMNKGICPHQVRCNDQSKDVGSSDPKRTAPEQSDIIRKALLLAAPHLIRGTEVLGKHGISLCG